MKAGAYRLARVSGDNMARLMDWQSIQALDDGVNRMVALDSLQFAYLQALSSFYQSKFSWVFGANDITIEQWDAIEYLQAQTELDLMGNMVGTILPNVLADISEMALLPCDGTTYLRTDYPRLYAAIASAYIIDADNFYVPDLRQKFPVGASPSVPIGTVGGEEDVTLEIPEIPSHSHSTTPHSHAESGAVPSTVIINAGAPVPTALPSASVTGLADVSIDNTGGGVAHNNIPPYHAISYVIVSD